MGRTINAILFIWRDYIRFVPASLPREEVVSLVQMLFVRSPSGAEDSANTQQKTLRQMEIEQWLSQAHVFFHRKQCFVCGPSPSTWKTRHTANRARLFTRSLVCWWYFRPLFSPLIRVGWNSESYGGEKNVSLASLFVRSFWCGLKGTACSIGSTWRLQPAVETVHKILYQTWRKCVSLTLLITSNSVQLMFDLGKYMLLYWLKKLCLFIWGTV